MMPNKVKDRKGHICGRLRVLEFSHISNNKGANAYWSCECLDCGNHSLVSSSHLSKTKHGCKACHGRKQMRAIKYRDGHNKDNDLYMIRCGPFVKIGITKNIKVRFSSLQAACPYPLELVGFWKGEGHREESWHTALAHKHVRGEWFKLGGSCEL